MSAPAELLLLRAVSSLEMAQLQMSAERYTEAAQSIEKGIQLVREALG